MIGAGTRIDVPPQKSQKGNQRTEAECCWSDNIVILIITLTKTRRKSSNITANIIKALEVGLRSVHVEL